MQTLQRTVGLHRAQRLFRRSSALYRGFVGGRGSGKSWVGAYDLLCRARPGHTYLVASPTYTKLEDETLATTQAIAEYLGLFGSLKRTPRPTLKLRSGATIRFRSAEDPEKLRGPNLSGVWLDEASLMGEEAYLIAIACLREHGEQGWLSATFTPKGRGHWTYKVFAKGSPRDVELIHCHTKENPFNPAGWADTLADQYGGSESLLSLQELGGQFVTVKGAEWPPEYFPESMWFTDWPAELACKTMALDPSKGKDAKHGDYSAIIKLGRDREGDLWVEADLARRPTVQIVADCLDQARTFRPDAFAVEVNQFQELLADDIINQSRTAGMALPIVPLNNQVNKLVRIRRLGPLLAQHRLRFRGGHPGTELLVQQLREFPEGDHDDGPDSLEMALRVMADWLAGVDFEESKFA